jgi:hypothetical protein
VFKQTDLQMPLVSILKRVDTRIEALSTQLSSQHRLSKLCADKVVIQSCMDSLCPPSVVAVWTSGF